MTISNPAAGRFGSGRAVKRVEDAALLAGKGLFVDNVAVDGQSYIAFQRSPYAHARIVSIDADAARDALVHVYDREGTQAFQRQNLDLAINKWDRILELDPANKKAKLERERAVDLKKKMSEKFGAKSCSTPAT